MRSIAVSLEVFIKKNGKYLMLHRHPNKRIMPDVWMAPGGRKEHNEGLFECTRREVLEETGLKIKNLRIKATGNAYLKDIDQELFCHLIVADWAGGKVRKEIDVGELVWLTPNQIYKLDNLLAELQKILPFVFSKNHKIVSYKAVYDKGNKMTEFILEDSK